MNLSKLPAAITRRISLQRCLSPATTASCVHWVWVRGVCCGIERRDSEDSRTVVAQRPRVQAIAAHASGSV